MTRGYATRRDTAQARPRAQLFGSAYKKLGPSFDSFPLSFISHLSFASPQNIYTMKLTAILANIAAIMAVGTCIEASAITNCVVDRVKTRGDEGVGSAGSVKEEMCLHPLIIPVRWVASRYLTLSTSRFQSDDRTSPP